MARTLVGLDIGSSGVRAAEFVPGRRRATLRRFAAVPLPPGVVRAGTVVDGEALTEAIKELWSLGKFGTKDVTPRDRERRRDGAPDGPRLDAAGGLPPRRCATRCRTRCRSPVDDANLDYHLLEELEVSDRGRRAPPGGPDPAGRGARDMVDAVRRRRPARRAAPDRASTCCPSRWSAPAPPTASTTAGEAEAIVDIGADVVSVVVHAGGVPRYVRIIPGIGGDAITAGRPAALRLDLGRRRAHQALRRAARPRPARRQPAARRSVPGARRPRPPRPAGHRRGRRRRWCRRSCTTLDFYRDLRAPSRPRHRQAVDAWSALARCC